MSKHLLSIFVACFLVGHLSAQVPQNAQAPQGNKAIGLWYHGVIAARRLGAGFKGIRHVWGPWLGSRSGVPQPDNNILTDCTGAS